MKKYFTMIVAVMLVLTTSVPVSADISKAACDCQIESFSVTVDGKSYACDGNRTYYIKSADELDVESITRTINKDSEHWSIHTSSLSYSFDDQNYQKVEQIPDGSGSSSINPSYRKISFTGKTDIYFKLEMAYRNDTAKYIHFSVAKEYKITYDLDGGKMTGNPDTFTELTQTFTLKDPVKQGYRFIGWTGTGLDMKVPEVTIENGSQGDRSYTAHWEKIQETTEEQTASEQTAESSSTTESAKKTEKDKKPADRKKESQVVKSGDEAGRKMALYVGAAGIALILIVTVFIKRRRK